MLRRMVPLWLNAPANRARVLAFNEALRAELRAELERDAELRTRRLARKALGYDDGRILSVDELIRIGNEMGRLTSERCPKK